MAKAICLLSGISAAIKQCWWCSVQVNPTHLGLVAVGGRLVRQELKLGLFEFIFAAVDRVVLHQSKPLFVLFIDLHGRLKWNRDDINFKPIDRLSWLEASCDVLPATLLKGLFSSIKNIKDSLGIGTNRLSWQQNYSRDFFSASKNIEASNSWGIGTNRLG